MSPVVTYHVTRSACRDSIRKHGLIASQPTILQPYGVYTYNDDFLHPVFSRGQCVLWGPHPYKQSVADVWRVAYIGPLSHDHFVANGLVLLRSTRPDEVTLVARNS